MSLALAIDQIRRPTWWYENDRTPQPKGCSPETIEMRRKILAYLRQAGEKVPATTVQQHFGLSNAQMWHYLNAMVTAGSVIKFKPKHDRCLLQAKDTGEEDDRTN